MPGKVPYWPRVGELLAACGQHFYAGRIDASGHYVEDYSGAGSEWFLGRPLAPHENAGQVWDNAVHPDDLEHYAAFNERLRRGLPSIGQYRIVGVDGVIRWVDDRARPLERSDDGSTSVEGVVCDITAQRSAQEEAAAVVAQLNVSNTHLARARRAAEQQAAVDPLTRLGNRRALLQALEQEYERARRERTSPAVIMLDVDHFKRINDSYGHAVGDEVLVAVADRLRGQIRPYDTLARWGGEEFCIVAPAVRDNRMLAAVAERVRTTVGDQPVNTAGGPLIVTLSAGTGRLRRDHTSAAGLIASADAALYAAKRRGRNRTVCEFELTQSDRAAEEPEQILIAQALALAASVREAIPPQHCEQVATLAGEVAVALGLPPQMIERSRISGWLHDIGKLALPDRVLTDRSTIERRRLLHQHAAIGGEIVHQIPSVADAATVVRHHHERWDGSGYPDSLAGEAIPIEARIVAVCDAFSAITAGRDYQQALGPDDALAALDSHAGEWYDPSVVAAMRSVVEQRDATAAARLAALRAS